MVALIAGLLISAWLLFGAGLAAMIVERWKLGYLLWSVALSLNLWALIFIAADTARRWLT